MKSIQKVQCNINCIGVIDCVFEVVGGGGGIKDI